MKVRGRVGDLVIVTWPKGTLGMSEAQEDNYSIPRGEMGVIVEPPMSLLTKVLWSRHGVLSVVSNHITVIDT